MKVAFYIDNSSISSVDCSTILDANPGIGGTECMIITVATLLAQRNNDIEAKLFTTHDGIFPASLSYKVVADFAHAISYAEENKYEYFVFKHDVQHIFNHSLDSVNNEVRLVVWCHVFACYWELDYYANNPAVYQMVCVSREMEDLYRDHKIYNKSSYIYNCVNLNGVKNLVAEHPFGDRKNIVTYVGCIAPFKGFHLLAEAWQEITRQVSDAELYVIGTGRLYNTNSRMGVYGIAEEKYESHLLKYLSKDGKILPNVHFMGMMGKEKNDILLKTKVGVPNPSGITETFGISAVEMQMMGAKVTTIKCPGYMETVVNGTLYSKRKSLADNVVALLKDNESNYDKAIQYFEENFSLNAVARQWEYLFLNGFLLKDTNLYNPCYRAKFLKEWMRRLKQFCPILYKLPPVERLLLLLEKLLGKKGIRYIDSNTTIF